MKARIAGVAVVLSALATAISALTLQPLLLRMVDALQRYGAPGSPEASLALRMRTLIPLSFALGGLLLLVVTYAILHFALGRPLERTEVALDRLGRIDEFPLEGDGGGPLLSRLTAALRRAGDALRREQQATQARLVELQVKNEQLARAQTELVASERLATVGRLAAGVAHEVGNPLAGILGYLSVARAPQRSAEQVRDFLDRIEAEVLRIDRIVRGLLDLGRPARGEAIAVPVLPLLRATADLVGKTPELAATEISLEVPAGCVARAEPGPLAQVALNLLLNGAQAAGGRGKLRVSGRVGEGKVTLDFDDAGPGIDPATLPRLFEPFFTTKPAGKGSGLGLAVCQHLVSAMGGRIWAENLPQGGARFSVELPAA